MSARALGGERFLQRVSGFARTAAGMRVGVIAQFVPINSGIVSESIHRYAITCAATLQMAMRQNKIRRIVIIADILREFIAAHPDRDVLPYFQV